MKKMFDVKDVATELNVSVPTVRKWVLEHKIKFVKISALVRFDPEEIERSKKEGLK